MVKPNILFISFIFCINFSYSQSYYFKHYQVEDGLSYNSVICTMQDSRGFLWFGTKDGLNRFDGYSFKTFRNNPNNSSSIGSNNIQSLIEDKNKNIWIGTKSGLYKYNPIDETFACLKGTKKNSITDIIIDQQENIWFISDWRLRKYNKGLDSYRSYSDDLSTVTSLCITDDQSLWISTDTGSLQHYNYVNDTFESYDVFSHSAPTVSNWIQKIESAGKNIILVGTKSQGVKKFNYKTATYEDVLTLNPDNTPIYVRDIMHYKDEEYWIATESGVFIYNLNKGLKRHLTKNGNDPFSLSDNAVYTLSKDKEGGVWIGTYFGGVNYYIEQNVLFEKIFSRSTGNILKNNAIRELCRDQYGALWIGTEDAGLVKFEEKEQKFTAFNSDGKKGSISNNNLHGLLEIGDELWIGTFEQGLDVMDIKTGKVIRNYKAGNGKHQLKSNFIETFFLTRNGQLLVGTSSGLYRYDKSNDEFDHIHAVPEHHINAIVEDEQGTIWLGTPNNGLYFYNPTKNTSGSFKFERSNPNSLIYNSVNDLFIDSKNNLWVATENGLCVYNFKQKKFTHISNYNNFPSNVFYKVLEDEHQNIWISTSRGLVRFEPTLKKLELFTKNNGLLNDQFNYKSGYKASDGSLYFGSIKGLIKFYPTEVVSNDFVPPIYFTGFQVFNKELEIKPSGSPLTNSMISTNKITLKPNQSTFSIDFAALSYSAPQMTKYSYRMSGVEDDWVHLETNRKVYFTNLSPGNYLFEVRATINSIWNQESATLKIEILPPFWASNFAYIIYFVIFSIAIYFFHAFNLKRLEEKNKSRFNLLENQKEREIYRAKLQFFTNITHEIRTPLTLIKGPLETAMKNVESGTELNASLETMKKNTDRLIHLTNQLLNFRKMEADDYSLSFVKTDVVSLLNESYNRFVPLAKEHKRSFEMKIPCMVLFVCIDGEAVKKIISNLFGNAIKYSISKIVVTLKLHEEENNFKITVKTDGKLIPLEMANKIFEPFFRLKESHNQSGTGIGLALARSLANLHHGKLQLAKAKNNMNTFVLQLPIHQNKSFALFKEPTTEKMNGLINETNVDNSDNQETILLVEDNIELIEFISSVLVKNYKIIKATNGKDVFDILKGQSVNLIISDIMMPVMDGYELCQLLKRNLEFSHIPIILLSAKDSLQSKVEGLEIGADSYIEKPFSPQYLLAQVESLLANREKIRTYFANSPLVHIKTMAYSTADAKFLEKIDDIINENIDDVNLDVEQLAWLMNMSRPTLYRKIKAVCNLSPLELIIITRLKKAAEFLVETDYKVYEIANKLGFSSQTQFTRTFVKHFDINPSKYRESKLGPKKEIKKLL